ncbi:MAG: ATP-binding protein [Spirulinaceae cyanobacterium]
MLTEYFAYIPHGHCFLWQKPLVILHIMSDSLIAIAYFSIPAMLLYFIFKRRDMPFPSLIILFGVFIVACGLTHLLGIWTLWYPDYWLSGGMKLFTGLVSVLTAAVLYPIIPQALELPSPEALAAMNAQLTQEVEERTKAEAAVRQLNEDLETRVSQRTEALEQAKQELEAALAKLQNTQAQLIQTEKMSSLGQLVAGVAHEINNPVNFIHGNLQPIQTYFGDLLELVGEYEQCYPQPVDAIAQLREDLDLDFLKSDLTKALNSMELGTSRIRSIVQSLRTFSRLDEAEMKAVDIHEGMESTLLILQNRLKGKGDRPAIQVQKHYGDLPLVDCYPSQLNQVFMNLISNGIDALEQLPSDRPPEITIQTQQPEPEQVEISISNNGPDIPPEVQSKIFDPFFTTKPIGKGTGLGLAISYQIITERHRGTLQVEAERNFGTIFTITIPAHQPEPEAEEPSTNGSQTSS